jgi:hypothetical protein
MITYSEYEQTAINVALTAIRSLVQIIEWHGKPNAIRCDR